MQWLEMSPEDREKALRAAMGTLSAPTMTTPGVATMLQNESAKLMQTLSTAVHASARRFVTDRGAPIPGLDPRDLTSALFSAVAMSAFHMMTRGALGNQAAIDEAVLLARAGFEIALQEGEASLRQRSGPANG